ADLAGASRGGPALRHAGVYAFRRSLLLEFASWPPGRLEQAERLEQLRAVERGIRIKVVLGERPFAGVGQPRPMPAPGRRGARAAGGGDGLNASPQPMVVPFLTHVVSTDFVASGSVRPAGSGGNPRGDGAWPRSSS